MPRTGPGSFYSCNGRNVSLSPEQDTDSLNGQQLGDFRYKNLSLKSVCIAECTEGPIMSMGFFKRGKEEALTTPKFELIFQ